MVRVLAPVTVTSLAALAAALSACGAGSPSAADHAPAPQAAALSPPAAPAPPAPTRYPDAVVSPITPAVAARLRAIAGAGPADARGDAFIKVGASGTVSKNLLHCLAQADPQYQLALDGRDHLRTTIDHVRAVQLDGTTPFDRPSLAARSGRTARWVLTGEPSPLTLELDALRPRYAFVNYGTNDMRSGATPAEALPGFWLAMQALLGQLEAAGAVPIITGLNPRGDDPDRARWVATYDAVTRALAEAHQVPYLSLVKASTPLAGHGLIADGIHGNVLMVDGDRQPCDFTAAGLAFNYNLRNLRSLELLDAARRAVAGEAAPDRDPLPPVAGDGTLAHPFAIDRLPFTHTPIAAPAAAAHACGPGAVYRLELPVATALRVVAPTGEVALAAGATCLERARDLVDRTVPAGVLDVLVSPATATVVVLGCDPGDPDC